MSDTNKAGPAMESLVQEVRGHFSTDAALQDALARLTLAGFDRASFSLPKDREDGTAVGNEGADNLSIRLIRASFERWALAWPGMPGPLPWRV